MSDFIYRLHAIGVELSGWGFVLAVAMFALGLVAFPVWMWAKAIRRVLRLEE